MSAPHGGLKPAVGSINAQPVVCFSVYGRRRENERKEESNPVWTAPIRNRRQSSGSAELGVPAEGKKRAG